MIVSSLGEIDAIEIPDGSVIFEYFRVRVLVGEATNPECVGIEDFMSFPESSQILWAVAKHGGSYAEVTKILVPDTLPFSGKCENCDCGEGLEFCFMGEKVKDGRQENVCKTNN